MKQSCNNYSHDRINRSIRSFKLVEQNTYIYTWKVTMEPYRKKYNKKEYNKRRIAEEGAEYRVSRESETRMGHCVV